MSTQQEYNAFKDNCRSFPDISLFTYAQLKKKYLHYHRIFFTAKNRYETLTGEECENYSLLPELGYISADDYSIYTRLEEFFFKLWIEKLLKAALEEQDREGHPHGNNEK